MSKNRNPNRYRIDRDNKRRKDATRNFSLDQSLWAHPASTTTPEEEARLKELAKTVRVQRFVYQGPGRIEHDIVGQKEFGPLPTTNPPAGEQLEIQFD